MANVLSRSLFSGLVATLVVAGSISAQDPDELFQEGVQLLRLGDREQALEKFEEVLSADPTNADAFRIWQSTDQNIFEMLLLTEGEISKIAKHLVNLARVERKQRSRDESTIAGLVEEATSSAGSYESRRKAVVSLMTDHGEFAVPGLVEKLANGDDEKGQIYAIRALTEIGRSATPGLIAALGSDNIEVRRNATAALAHIRDERAAAALARLATDAGVQESVRLAASKALRMIGVSADASPLELFLSDAHRLLRANGVRDGDHSDVTWSLQDGQLVATDVPAGIYNLELAKKSAHAALSVDPGSSTARSLLARAYLGEAAAIENSLAANSDDDAMLEMADKVATLRMVAAATGPDVLSSAISQSIAEDMVPTAVAGIEMLASTQDRRALGRSPVVAALGSNHKAVRYAAALALANSSGSGQVPAAEQVVRTLGVAIQEKASRRIQVVGGDQVASKAIRHASSHPNRSFVEASDSVAAINNLYVAPNIDVIVINEVLPNARPESLIGLIRKDKRMEHIKIVILTNDEDGAQEQFGDSIDATIEGPLSGETLMAKIDEVLDGELSVNQAQAEATATAASGALRNLAEQKVGIDGSIATIADQLTRTDAVAIPAAQAIGFGGNTSSLSVLIEVIGGDDASLDLKVACADAAGRILVRAQELPAEAVSKLMGMLGDADAKLRMALAAALGKAKLDPVQSLQLIEALSGSSSADDSEG